ncbi:hypothetical protein V493_00376 [Pseudogymnoascus sp. VKM F-4281 (FW-2241)]|nr:hypothetical protein V493_00376 [Pseudogymnoascus sp. VKM F-4281 (FW-2241)]
MGLNGFSFGAAKNGFSSKSPPDKKPNKFTGIDPQAEKNRQLKQKEDARVEERDRRQKQLWDARDEEQDRLRKRTMDSVAEERKRRLASIMEERDRRTKLINSGKYDFFIPKKN